MDADSVACKQSDAVFIVWMRHLDKYKTDELAARLASKHLGCEAVDAMHHSRVRSTAVTESNSERDLMSLSGFLLSGGPCFGEKSSKTKLL
ncbi:hypothetical protein AJ79_05350 [Helicocarpus griseus UAMH5409]|uniref:Uncharacterized protein n=1 Tax=Helicocarpus griseus UAMH5409 TaxID=1447875 RepID=A0A2B7XN98_9EURO|nr:hypothetical protein AJ79_05350 [Helicocarpus griseus UAMH5409]